MNVNLLINKSLSLDSTFIRILLPYGHVGKWGLQVFYWFYLLAIPRFFETSSNDNGIPTIFLLLLFIWPINQFLVFPNKIKRYNLKVYEQLKN